MGQRLSGSVRTPRRDSARISTAILGNARRVSGAGRGTRFGEDRTARWRGVLRRDRGDRWRTSTEWTSDAALDNWHGVTARGRVVRGIVLPATGPRGPLAPEIPKLIELRILDLGENYLSGNFPAVTGSMTWLETIRISSNRGG